MNKEFCTYNQALALKELGFDERCFGHYNPNGVFFWKILCSDEDNDHTLSVKDIMEHVADGYVEAPLYQQAFRWFREKHGLYVSINIHADNMWSVVVKSMTSNSTHTSGYVVDLINKGYSTFKIYEEAESACLDKLIEICKTKTNEQAD